MTERLLSVDAEPLPGNTYRRLRLPGHAMALPDSASDRVAAELDRLYAAAEANQAPGPDWKAKLREDVEGLKRQAEESTAARWVLVDVLGFIDALPDPPTPDPDAPPVYVPPEGHYAPVEGKDVPDGWEGRYYVTGASWRNGADCRRSPDMLFEVRRVPAPEPATEWVPLTKLVGRTMVCRTKAVHPTELRFALTPPYGPEWLAPNGYWVEIHLDENDRVEVLAEGGR